MRPVEKLHYALGEIAYVMAWSDKKISIRDIERFMDVLTEDLETNTDNFDLLGTMFSSITGDKKDVITTYYEAMNQIRKNSQHLDYKLKISFINTLERVERTYAPFTLLHQPFSIIDQFKNDIATVNQRDFYMDTFSLN